MFWSLSLSSVLILVVACVGPIGAVGPQGPVGSRGLQDADGGIGPRGPVGSPGLKGPSGESREQAVPALSGPIAYGVISTAGPVKLATEGVTSSWDNDGRYYEIVSWEKVTIRIAT